MLPIMTVYAIFFDLGDTLVGMKRQILESAARLIGFTRPQEIDRTIAMFKQFISDEWSCRLEEDFQWVRTEKDEHRYWLDFYACALSGIESPSDWRRAVGFLAEKTADPGSFACFPDVKRTLRILAERGFTLGIISNAFPSAGRILARLGLTDLVEHIVLSCEYGGPTAKPKPDIYLYALERAGVDSTLALFVDDRPAFVQGAVAKSVAMQAALIDRDGQQQKWDGYRISSLEEIPQSCRPPYSGSDSPRGGLLAGFAARFPDSWPAGLSSGYPFKSYEMSLSTFRTTDLEANSNDERSWTRGSPWGESSTQYLRSLSHHLETSCPSAGWPFGWSKR